MTMICYYALKLLVLAMLYMSPSLLLHLFVIFALFLLKKKKTVALALYVEYVPRILSKKEEIIVAVTVHTAIMNNSIIDAVEEEIKKNLLISASEYVVEVVKKVNILFTHNKLRIN